MLLHRAVVPYASCVTQLSWVLSEPFMLVAHQLNLWTVQAQRGAILSCAVLHCITVSRVQVPLTDLSHRDNGAKVSQVR